MKHERNYLDLRCAYKPVPDAFQKTVLQTVQSVVQAQPEAAALGRTSVGSFRRLAFAALIGLCILGMAIAYAVAHPAVFNWLLGYDGETNQPYAAGTPLSSTAQIIRGENAGDHIHIRMDSLVYDGERFSFSYEMENDDPASPALVALDPCFLLNGEQTRLEESLPNDADPILVPTAQLNVLPVQRNPVVCGGWSQIIPGELEGNAACAFTFTVYRPKKAFAFVPDPDDPILHPDDCLPDQQAEVQDVIDTLHSFRNTVLANADRLDPETWFQEGYSVIGGSKTVMEWDDPNEEGFDHLTETACFTVTFEFDAGIRQSFDFSDRTDTILEDCILSINRFRLSPLTTVVDVLLIPHENTREAAERLMEEYGPMNLTDEHGKPVEYAQMDTVYENMPWASRSDGQWRCRYRIEMPGLSAWPQSVGLTVNTGDLLRVTLE